MKLKILILTLLITIGCMSPVQEESGFSPEYINTNYNQTILEERQLLIGDAGWHATVRLDSTEYLFYLNTRKQQGFNTLLYAWLVSDYQGFVPFTNAYGDNPFVDNYDWSTRVVEYWDYTEWCIAQANNLGFTVFITPSYIGWSCGTEGLAQYMLAQTTNEMRNFGRWVGQRFGSYDNIVWVAGGDWDSGLSPCTVESRMDAIMEGILEYDTNAVMTSHNRRTYSGYEADGTKSWFNYNTAYSRYADVASEVKQEFDRNMEFILFEAFYEQENNCNALCAREQGYKAILGGAEGYIYGAGPSSGTNFSTAFWNFGINWENNIYMEGAEDMIHLRNLFLSRDWKQLVPDYSNSIVTSGKGNLWDSSYISAAHLGNRTIIAYVNGNRNFTVNIPYAARVWWYNPRNGEAILYATTNGSSVVFNSGVVGTGDWVLVIDKYTESFCDPGILKCGNGGKLPPNIGD